MLGNKKKCAIIVGVVMSCKSDVIRKNYCAVVQELEINI